eukprot:g33373.t1
MSVEVEAELQFGRSSVLGLAMYGVQCFFLIVFIVELILNIRCHGLSFFYRRGGPAMSANCIEALHELGYKIHFQGIFDFFVVLAALVDLCIMRPINLVGGADGSTASDAFSAFRVLEKAQGELEKLRKEEQDRLHSFQRLQQPKLQN